MKDSAKHSREPAYRSGHALRALLLLFLFAAGASGFSLGCGRSGQEDTGAGHWAFDGSRIVSAGDGTPLTGMLVNERWAAVVDAEKHETAWLQIPGAEEPRLTEVEPGRRWTCDGLVLGPGRDISGVLRDNKLIEYTWEVEKTGDRALSVTLKGEMLQHVVLASFSSFTIRLPLFQYAGARAIVDGAFGGTIRRTFRRGQSHPSYWEGPARSIRIEGRDATVDVEVAADGFTWVSLLDGRALQAPDTSLVLELYPAIAGPHERLGSLVMKGTQFASSFTFTLSPPPRKEEAPAVPIPAERLNAPGDLPQAAVSELAGALWETEPFISTTEAGQAAGLSFALAPNRCELPVRAPRGSWTLDVDGDADPIPAYVAVRGPVEDLRLKINGVGDCLDGGEIVDELHLESLDGKGRAEALWRYAAETTYPMPVYPTNDFGEFAGSYGYGLSSTLSAMALVKLWGHAGLPARRAYIEAERGSAQGEVYYDGDWHLYDLAARTFYLTPGDMSVPSAAELIASPALAVLNSDAGGTAPDGAPSEKTARLRFENAEVSYNMGNVNFERLMRVSLRKGETLLRLFRPLGRFAPSPTEPRNYTNALLVFEPDLEDSGALEGFTNPVNCVIDRGRIVPEDPNQPASLEYRASSPYVIVQSHLKIGGTPRTLKRIYPMLSKDEGITWTSLAFDTLSGTVDLTPHLVPGPQPAGTAYEKIERNFSFVLHIAIPSPQEGEDGGIESISVVTWGQVNPSLLPRLSTGKNTLETECTSWGEGASVDIGWIEGAAGADQAYVGEDFVLSGNIVNSGDVAAGCAVSAYALHGEARTALGSWKTEDPLRSGERTAFNLTCTPDEPASLSPDLQSGVYDIILEIDGAASAWRSTSRIRTPLLNRPDLVVLPGLVSTHPSRPRPGQEIEIIVPVRNFCPARNLLYLQGAPSAQAEVALFDISGSSRKPIQRVSIPELPPGAAAAAVFRWTAPPNPGRVSLEIAADPDDLVRERDERNTATIQIDITQ